VSTWRLKSLEPITTPRGPPTSLSITLVGEVTYPARAWIIEDCSFMTGAGMLIEGVERISGSSFWRQTSGVSAAGYLGCSATSTLKIPAQKRMFHYFSSTNFQGGKCIRFNSHVDHYISEISFCQKRCTWNFAYFKNASTTMIVASL